MISIRARYLMITCSFHSNPLVNSFLHCWLPCCAERGACVPAVRWDTSGGCLDIRVQDGRSSSLRTLPCHRGCTAETPHLPCLTPLSPALTKPPSPSPLPPPHVCTPPSGSSKYFPSVLFEASMGQATSCTNHAGWPWGGRPERRRTSRMHGNPIRTVFVRG